ncbi:MAG: dihydroneopterin aldolase [Alphaproteobacteria bacterium]|nr:dihydroneopterin aldolase [Alphaproteobacteria bacterium]MBV9693411.1 dihydroneopterin aldolase [Alphaproteobacteria bacterium]
MSPSSVHGVRHILVSDLEFAMQIGAYHHEKGRMQRVRINLDLTVPDTPVDDHRLASVLDYCALVDRIRGHAVQGHVHLVETLAERIAALCLEDERVLHARIRVEKLEAIEDAAAAGVEIERRRG